MSRLEQIARAAYQIKFQWECEFDEADIETLQLHALCQSPLCKRDALYVGRTEATRINYKAREGVTIQYVDVMSL